MLYVKVSVPVKPAGGAYFTVPADRVTAPPWALAADTPVRVSGSPSGSVSLPSRVAAGMLSVVFSGVVALSGLATGGALTDRATVLVADSGPPVPVLPWSLVTRVSVSPPW